LTAVFLATVGGVFLGVLAGYAGGLIDTAIMPNIMAPIIILISLSVGTVILLESGLSFLGMGPPPPTSTWGNMIGRCRDLMDIKPIMVVWPPAAVAVTVLAFDIFGDGLRDVLDPRLKI
jgi:ABC-type dipeptide/oligopeptide/nickel transport system permease subunit